MWFNIVVSRVFVGVETPGMGVSNSSGGRPAHAKSMGIVKNCLGIDHNDTVLNTSDTTMTREVELDRSSKAVRCDARGSLRRGWRMYGDEG